MNDTAAQDDAPTAITSPSGRITVIFLPVSDKDFPEHLDELDTIVAALADTANHGRALLAAARHAEAGHE